MQQRPALPQMPVISSRAQARFRIVTLNVPVGTLLNTAVVFKTDPQFRTRLVSMNCTVTVAIAEVAVIPVINAGDVNNALWAFAGGALTANAENVVVIARGHMAPRLVGLGSNPLAMSWWGEPEFTGNQSITITFDGATLSNYEGPITLLIHETPY